MLCRALVVMAEPAAARAPEDVSRLLEHIRAKHKVPSLAVAVLFEGGIVATNAVGVRKQGDSQEVTPDDKYHLGSITKSMTATVAAMLVEQGRISWTTTVGELFPDLRQRMHPKYRGVTLEQLLAHRGGAPGEPLGKVWAEAWEARGTPAEQRLAFVAAILARKPETEPAPNRLYAIPGVMLGMAAEKSWEYLMRSMLFQPLGMSSAGFGALGVSQPTPA